MIKIKDEIQKCHRCGSKNLYVINIDKEEKTFVVWCNNCDEQTLENTLKLDKIESYNLNYIFIKENSENCNFTPSNKEDEDFEKLLHKEINIKEFLIVHDDIAVKACVYGLLYYMNFKNNIIYNVEGSSDQMHLEIN